VRESVEKRRMENHIGKQRFVRKKGSPQNPPKKKRNGDYGSCRSGRGEGALSRGWRSGRGPGRTGPTGGQCGVRTPPRTYLRVHSRDHGAARVQRTDDPGLGDTCGHEHGLREQSAKAEAALPSLRNPAKAKKNRQIRRNKTDFSARKNAEIDRLSEAKREN
jgi:hypothetical protein